MSTYETLNGSGAEPEREEQDIEAQGRARDARVRNALEFIRESSTQDGASMILGALAPLAIEEDGAEAYEMAVHAVTALVFKNPRTLAAARKFYADQRGCDSTQHAIAIVKLNEAVEAALHVIQLDGTDLFPEKQVVLQTLAEYIKTAFGGTACGGMPTAADLEHWLSQHVPKAARGKMTTVGIDAAIVHQAKLLGARGSLARTRGRIDAVLRRRRKAERALRERFQR
jgi:hypothetical protein